MNPLVFLPHGMCFNWSPGVLLLHTISDALIGIAYFAIAGFLTYLVRERDDLPFKWIFAMFALFIVSCGTTHFMSIWVIWHPNYWTEGWIKALTAAASIATAVLLVPLLPKALQLRSPRELERLNSELAATLGELHAVVRSYEHEKYIASSFQSASLSDIPKRIGTIEVSAVYRPGSNDLSIGGDWYDAFELVDGRIVISIGDVTGTGLTASIIMSKIRQSIRVAAQIQVDPARVLDAASRSLEIEFPDTIVTAFVGIIDTVEETMTYANAGHLPPMVRRRDGTVSELWMPSLPLGLRRRGEGSSASWPLIPGSLLVLYTDGLTESTRDYAEGDRRLFRALAADDVLSVEDPARTIFERILFDGARDDVAILTLRIGIPLASATADAWTFESSDERSAAGVRAAIHAKLLGRRACAEDIFNADMVLSELLSNAYRYAPGPVTVRLMWRGETMILHVLDDGDGFEFLPELPADPLSEHGRGLFIINALTDYFHIRRRENGGSHARAVLRAKRHSGRQPMLAASR